MKLTGTISRRVRQLLYGAGCWPVMLAPWLPLVLGLMFAPGRCAEKFPLPFCSSLWKADFGRAHMVSSLRRAEWIIGATEHELVEQLGQPDGWSREVEPYWHVGIDNGLGMDTIWFGVRFDARGLVDEALTWGR